MASEQVGHMSVIIDGKRYHGEYRYCEVCDEDTHHEYEKVAPYVMGFTCLDCGHETEVEPDIDGRY